MPPFGPISRRELIRALIAAGFRGPEGGSKHQVMIRGNLKLRIPNPHEGDVSTSLLHRLLKQAGISRREWEEIE